MTPREAFRLFGKAIEKAMDNLTMDELIELKEADKVLKALVKNKEKLELALTDALSLPKQADYGNGYICGLETALELIDGKILYVEYVKKSGLGEK